MPYTVLKIIKEVPALGLFKVKTELNISLLKVAGNNLKFVSKVELNCIKFNIILKINPILKIVKD